MKKEETPQLTKKIEVGKFYLIHDGSKFGHPGYVMWKNDDKNRYLVVRFDSDKFGSVTKKSRGIRHITELLHPLDKTIACSYAKNRPLLCKRRDIGKELIGLSLHQDDYKIVERVAKADIQYSPSFKR